MLNVPFRRTAGWVIAAAAVAACLPAHRAVGAQAPTTDVPVASRAAVAQADRVARIDAFLQGYVDTAQVAGVVAVVLQDGQTVYEKALGWRDREAKDAMRIDSIFRIASQSKAITSAAIMMLVEEGRVRLADPVSRFIPPFAKTTVAEQTDGGITTVPARRQIQIRDLLTHTSGMSYGTDAHVADLYRAKGLGPAAGAGWYFADKTEPICASIERLATLPFVSHPGDAYVYGYNTDVLGCVIERASGLSLDQFIRSRITEPLGMADTHFYLPPDKRNRLAAVYGSGTDAGQRAVRADDGPRGQGAYVDGPRASFSGGAGLLSTAHDYARFLEMIRRGGVHNGQRLLGTRAVGLMTTNQIGDIRATGGLGYGYGFETTDRYGANELDPAGAFGWGGAYGSIYRVDPESRLVMVLMFQLMPNATDLRQKFATLVYQAFAN
ncbi:MAG: beta-lactamase family protein [Acidobacteria bacterium]|nr:beta-lactamase family protein [Acidobacteriota bacterium]